VIDRSTFACSLSFFEMKFVYVALAVLFAAYCCVADEFVNDDVNHIIIAADQEGAVFQWKQGSVGYAYCEACFGTIKMFQKRTSDINPATDEPYCTFDSSFPIWEINLTANYYYGFYPTDTSNSGPNGINGALDLFVSTDVNKRTEMIPGTPGKIVDMKISMNSGTATLTWESTGVDNTTLYRKDVPLKDYSKEAWYPPPSYYMTGCSAKLWMTVDAEATAAVQISHADEKYTGLVKVTGINDKTVTIVAVTTEKKDIQNPFTRSYDFVALGAASTTIVSTLALLLLLVSVLII